MVTAGGQWLPTTDGGRVKVDAIRAVRGVSWGDMTDETICWCIPALILAATQWGTVYVGPSGGFATEAEAQEFLDCFFLPTVDVSRQEL